MCDEANIRAWIDDAPEEVRDVTESLLKRVSELRESQVIYPPQDLILNALELVHPHDVKVVILGQDPYHGPNQAMGLSFSVPVGQKLPPSLRNIYKELAADVGCTVPQSGDLTPWAKQGVLLLNATLTVQEHAANSHSKLGWQVLTNYLVKHCFQMDCPVVFMGWGKNAIQVIEAAQREVGEAGLANKLVLKSTHPSPLSANRSSGQLQAFIGSRPFSRANDFLLAKGAEPIDWACLG